MSRFDHRNNKKRFDLYSFYALLVKCKIVELLDQSGKTPFDSESIDKNVSVYNAYVTQDAVDLGGALPYANNASVRQFLYSLDAQDGINDSENIITPGFNRTYYTLPLSDSEGTIEHTSVYTFLKSHFDRWLKYDPYERRKIASRIIDTLDVDSDLRYRYGDNFLIACEEDSDLSRRITEVFSNVMQTANDSDSESGHHTVRNEILKATITALRGLTPGGDSDTAVDLGHVITGVLNNNSDSDSDIRNKFGDLFIDALRKDSDTADSDLQNRLRDIISNTELPFVESPITTVRTLLPMPVPPVEYVPGTTIMYRGETTFDRKQSFYVNVNDALGGAPPPPGSVITPPYYGGSGVVIKEILIAGDLNSYASENIDFTIQGDSDGAGNIQNNAFDLQDFIFTGFQDDVFRPAVNSGGSTYFSNFNVTNYLIIDSAGNLGTPGHAYLKINTIYSFGVGTFPFASDPLGSLTHFKFKIVFDSDSLISSDPLQTEVTGSIGDPENKFALANFTTLRSDDVKLSSLTGSGIFDVVTLRDSEGRLGSHDGLQWLEDSDSDNSDKLQTYRVRVYGDSKLATTKVSDLSKDRVVFSSDSDGRLGTNFNLQFKDSDTLDVPNIFVNNDSKFNATRVADIRKDGLVFVSDSDGRLSADSDLEFTRDSDKLVLSYQGRRQLALDSEKFFNLLIANDQYYTLDSEGVDSVITDTPVKSETSWVIGQKGDVYFIDSDQSNQLETKPLVYITDKVIDTSAELARATNDRVTKITVFNTWARFSHQYTGGATPGTYNYPAILAEEQGWAYDASADLIYTTVNSVSYAGFVSSDTYQNYTFDSIFKTYNDNTNDDDVISSVIGFVTEGVKGQPGYREHTLQVIRNSGGFPMLTQNYGSLGPVCWALVYNYNQDDVRLLVNKTTSAPVTTAPWNSYPYGTKVFIKRTGDIIKAYCSQMNDSTYTLDSDTEIIWDLSSDSDTNKFRGPVRYGYGVHSQKGASWSDIVFKPDQGTYLHYMPDGTTGSSGGNVYEYNIDSERWSIDTSLTVDNTVGNRLLHNSSTRKTFFNNPSDDKVYQIMTASKFTDVMNLPILTSAPAVSVAGTFAIADGVGWDPVGYGAPAYIVFNDGTGWWYVDAQP